MLVSPERRRRLKIAKEKEEAFREEILQKVRKDLAKRVKKLDGVLTPEQQADLMAAVPTKEA